MRRKRRRGRGNFTGRGRRRTPHGHKAELLYLIWWRGEVERCSSRRLHRRTPDIPHPDAQRSRTKTTEIPELPQRSGRRKTSVRPPSELSLLTPACFLLRHRCSPPSLLLPPLRLFNPFCKSGESPPCSTSPSRAAERSPAIKSQTKLDEALKTAQLFKPSHEITPPPTHTHRSIWSVHRSNHCRL